MRITTLAAILGATLAALGPAAALADDWVAVKLHGVVLTLTDGKWTRLHENDVVPDDRIIRTLRSGTVEFRRDGETIEIVGDTQIAIHDRTNKRFTVVTQYFGTTNVEANVEKVQHFAVETPYMAAVVKGTIFSVKTRDGVSSAFVSRGRVEVDDLKSGDHVDILPGQHASTGENQALAVGGSGPLQPIRDAKGHVVTPGKGGPTPGKGHWGEDSRGGANPGNHNSQAHGNSADHTGTNNSGGNSGNGNSGNGNSGNGNSGKGNSGGAG